MVVAYVLATDESLAAALLQRLGQADGIVAARFGEEARPGPRSFVLAPVRDCSPTRCAELVRDGFGVVVLAPVVREAERERYLDAGATAYLPMVVDFALLVRALRGPVLCC